MADRFVIAPRPAIAQYSIDLIAFASSYNAYSTLSSQPDELDAIFTTFERQFMATGTISPSLQVEFLRGWLFMIYRDDHFSNSMTWSIEDATSRDRLMFALVERIGELSDGTPLPVVP